MRILIATVAAGGGHVKAAAALEEAWLAQRPHDWVERLDLLELAPKLYKKVYVDGYINLVKHAPELYAIVFKKTDNPELVRKMTTLRRAFARQTNKVFIRHLKKSQPNVVLCPHYLPLEILGDLKAKGKGFNPFTVCIVTDFEAHALWMENSVDLYCVAAEETKARLLARGAPFENVAVTGIPISARFSTRLEKAEVRKGYGLSEELPTLLVLGGGFGLGPVGEILHEIDKLDQPIQTIVVTGVNEKLRHKLASLRRRYPTWILGFVSNMDELMAVSDLILTKPGGLTSAEALAMGKPLLILNPIPGQEAANSDFLLERGAAAKVNRLVDLPFRLEQLLGSKKLTGMAQAAKALGRPHAAQEICRRVIQRVSFRFDGELTKPADLFPSPLDVRVVAPERKITQV